jgi:glycosyltransferase involved in cell wall biosynthesis
VRYTESRVARARAMEPEATPELSVVILCYRAEEYVRAFVPVVETALAALGVPFEVVLVANYHPGQGDRTPAVAREVAAAAPHRRAVARPKEGMMGWDMRSGLEVARGRVLAVIDGDGQFPADDIARVYQALRDRELDLCQTHRVRRQDGAWRWWVSRIYNGVFGLLFPGTGLHDVNAKPKLLTRAAYHAMTLRSTDWFVDAEIVIEARRLGLRMGEVPAEVGRGVRPSFVRPRAILEFVGHLVAYRVRATRRRW